jgi:hypothetical protein
MAGVKGDIRYTIKATAPGGVLSHLESLRNPMIITSKGHVGSYEYLQNTMTGARSRAYSKFWRHGRERTLYSDINAELFALLTEERFTGENPSYIVSGSAVTSAPHPCDAGIDA